ncbi:MAG: hypothetical protein ACTSRK_15315 [Promethearchaeota archaeon]
MHFRELADENIFDIRPILNRFHLGTTIVVKEEMEHYKLDSFLNILDWHIIDISHTVNQKQQVTPSFLQKLDKQDQSLWVAARHFQKEGYLILTDDGELFMECQTSGIPALRSPDFLLLLVQESSIKKNTMVKCLRYWVKTGRFKRQELNRWKMELNKIS